MAEYLRPVPAHPEATQPIVFERPLARQLRGVFDDYSLHGFYDLQDIREDERLQEICSDEQRAALGPVLSRYRGQVKEQLIAEGNPDTRWIFPDKAFKRAYPETRDTQCCLVLGLNKPLTGLPVPTTEMADSFQDAIDSHLPRPQRRSLVSIYHRPAVEDLRAAESPQVEPKKTRRERPRKPPLTEPAPDEEPLIEPARLGRLASAMLDGIISAENPTQGVKPRILAEAITESNVDADLVKRVAGQLPTYFQRLRIKQNLRLSYTDYEVRRAHQRDRLNLQECMGSGLTFDEYRDYTSYDALSSGLFDNPYQ